MISILIKSTTFNSLLLATLSPLSSCGFLHHLPQQPLALDSELFKGFRSATFPISPVVWYSVIKLTSRSSLLVDRHRSSESSFGRASVTRLVSKTVHSMRGCGAPSLGKGCSTSRAQGSGGRTSYFYVELACCLDTQGAISCWKANDI